MLWQYRNEWDMAFVDSGAAAIEKMREHPFDIVVSDIKMPGMDGVELLSEVQRRHPGTIRMILSGQADRMEEVRATGVSHQFLAKPCTAETVHDVVDRAIRLREALREDAVVERINGNLKLPAAPTIFNRLTGELLSEEPSLSRVADIVAEDPALAAEILRMVGSSFFAIRRQISDIHDAVKLLGTDTIRALALQAHVLASATGRIAPLVESVRSNSVRVAAGARAIALHAGGSKGLVSAAATAGLLHDIGWIVAAAGFPDTALDLFALPPSQEAEREQFGVDHGLIGGYVLSTWGLPDEVVEAVTYHHLPSESGVDGFTPLAAVHVADVFVRDPDLETLDRGYLERCCGADIQGWIETLESLEP